MMGATDVFCFSCLKQRDNVSDDSRLLSARSRRWRYQDTSTQRAARGRRKASVLTDMLKRVLNIFDEPFSEALQFRRVVPNFGLVNRRAALLPLAPLFAHLLGGLAVL